MDAVFSHAHIGAQGPEGCARLRSDKKGGEHFVVACLRAGRLPSRGKWQQCREERNIALLRRVLALLEGPVPDVDRRPVQWQGGIIHGVLSVKVNGGTGPLPCREHDKAQSWGLAAKLPRPTSRHNRECHVPQDMTASGKL